MLWGKDGYYKGTVSASRVHRGRKGSKPCRLITIDYDDGVTATHALDNTTIVAGGTGEPQGKPVTPQPAAETDDDGFGAIVSDMAQRIATVASAGELGDVLEDLQTPANADVSVLSVERQIFDVETGEKVRSSEMVMLVDGKVYSIDTANQ